MAPKYKKNLAEKIQPLVDRLNQLGANESLINTVVRDRMAKSMQKYGNRSKLIDILKMNNNRTYKAPPIFRNNDEISRKINLKSVSEYNKARFTEAQA